MLVTVCTNIESIVYYLAYYYYFQKLNNPDLNMSILPTPLLFDSLRELIGYTPEYYSDGLRKGKRSKGILVQ